MPKHLKVPFTIMARRVQRASHSSMLVKQNNRVSKLKQSQTVRVLGLSTNYKKGSLCYLCDVRTTARPSLITLTMEFHRRRRDWGSIPVVGSSWKDTLIFIIVMTRLKHQARALILDFINNGLVFYFWKARATHEQNWECNELCMRYGYWKAI